MEKKVILTSEGARQFNHALELLNNSIKEFNQVADEMIPELLIANGLASYLNDFCKNLESETRLKVSFSISDMNIKAKEEIEAAIFRSLRKVVELLIKFSRPSSILFQLNKLNNKINLAIKDDGSKNILKNPDITIKQEIENVKSILSTHNGKLYVNPNEVNGNEVEIQVPL